MSTEYQTSNSRFQILAKLEEKIFHINDLAKLWHIENKNTLYVTIHRYASQKLIYRLYKGFYSIKPMKDLDPLLIGLKAMHQYAYISTETILAESGIIQQLIPGITMISAESRKFLIGNNEYICRKMKDISLFNPVGIEHISQVKKANVTRAVADLLYYNKMAHFDNTNPIDWHKVKEMQIELSYPLTKSRYK